MRLTADPGGVVSRRFRHHVIGCVVHLSGFAGPNRRA
jgi:hypothetical protein